MDLYGSPGLGSLSFSYAQSVRLRQQQTEIMQKISTEINALRQDNAKLAKTLTEKQSENAITIETRSGGASSKKALDVI